MPGMPGPDGHDVRPDDVATIHADGSVTWKRADGTVVVTYDSTTWGNNCVMYSALRRMTTVNE